MLFHTNLEDIQAVLARHSEDRRYAEHWQNCGAARCHWVVLVVGVRVRRVDQQGNWTRREGDQVPWVRTGLDSTWVGQLDSWVGCEGVLRGDVKGHCWVAP